MLGLEGDVDGWEIQSLPLLSVFFNVYKLPESFRFQQQSQWHICMFY